MKTYEEHAVIQKETAAWLTSEISSVCAVNRFDRVLEIGCGTGILTRSLINNYQINEITANDIVDAAEYISNDRVSFIQGDAMNVPFNGRFNLIASSSTLQWIPDIKSLLNKCKGLLKEDGILAFATYGEKNIQEIRNLMNIGLSYKTSDEISELMKNDFELLSTKEAIKHMYFNTPVEILKHFGKTGVNGIINHRFTRESLRQFKDHFSSFYINGRGYSLTFHPMIFIARKKSE